MEAPAQGSIWRSFRSYSMLFKVKGSRNCHADWATLTGEPLYAKFGYVVVERYEIPMADGLRLSVVRMSKRM